MTVPNTSPEALDGFPPRPDGSDELRIHIVAHRPADTPSPNENVGLDLMATGITEQILAAFQAIGCPRDEIYAQASIIDEGDAPVVRLGDVIPEEQPPAEDPPADVPPSE